MKNIRIAAKKAAKEFWNDEDAQGMIEYILILVAVVGIATFLGPRILEIVQGKTEDLGSQVSGFEVN